MASCSTGTSELINHLIRNFCCTGATNRTAQVTHTAAAGRHLLLDVDQIISNLSSSSDLDTGSVATPFGLEVYGNDQPTGLIADSGSTEVHTDALTCLTAGCELNLNLDNF